MTQRAVATTKPATAIGLSRTRSVSSGEKSWIPPTYTGAITTASPPATTYDSPTNRPTRRPDVGTNRFSPLVRLRCARFARNVIDAMSAEFRPTSVLLYRCAASAQ